MGTYIIRPIATDSVIGWEGIKVIAGVIQPPDTITPLQGVLSSTVLGAGNSEYLAIGTGFSVDLTGIIRFSFVGLSIYLDGSIVPTAFNSLPAGFRVLTASVNCNVGGQTGQFFTQFDELTEDTTPNSNFPYPTTPLPSMLSLYLGGMGYRGACDAGEYARLNNGNLAGTYDIFLFTTPITDAVHFAEKGIVLDPRSFTMGFGGSGATRGIKSPGITRPGYNFPPVIGSGNYVLPANMEDAGAIFSGDLIRVVSTDIDMDGLTGIVFTYLDSLGATITLEIPTSYYYYISLRLLIFAIPSFFELALNDPTIPGYPNIPIIPILTVQGTQFSGNVPLEPLVITLADASGIYTIIPDKINDTLYDNVDPPETTDVKIPNPFIKTGYIGG